MALCNQFAGGMRQAVDRWGNVKYRLRSFAWSFSCLHVGLVACTPVALLFFVLLFFFFLLYFSRLLFVLRQVRNNSCLFVLRQARNSCFLFFICWLVFFVDPDSRRKLTVPLSFRSVVLYAIYGLSYAIRNMQHATSAAFCSFFLLFFRHVQSGCFLFFGSLTMVICAAGNHCADIKQWLLGCIMCSPSKHLTYYPYQHNSTTPTTRYNGRLHCYLLNPFLLRRLLHDRRSSKRRGLR